ncbi:GntR family transcriptional regulator/MocR family aminotransferase [Paenibacillus rhizosphaerae]|uniref:GntR family transcriptional regulator/MocR family aminotransferase n=1 Tax=Paenibacillus rhizosphaerae TaxID=297318 RepID=A0A839TLE4_9BACL|nr:PLP-dependent aminotransferase family protein [Paenibacillus rhizosphaerae]MBB3126550.1 GntR family transcriptional regulator/MocR family aminotransferase [Paenibacillus rhizosphaerae]
MFDLLLPEHSGSPLYLQIYHLIHEQIRLGKVAAGTRLPSVRALQQQLLISKTPIETAYHMLVAEGYVINKPKSGFYVVDDPEFIQNVVASSPAWRIPLNHTVAGFHDRLPEEGMDWIDFNPTHMDGDSFPLQTWNKMLKEAAQPMAAQLGQYGDSRGEPGLRAAVSEYLAHSRGVLCSPEQVIIGSGMSYSIGILVKLLDGVRRVAFEEPGFDLVRNLLNGYGWETVPIPVKGQGLLVGELSKVPFHAVYVTPSHQFPTGSIMPYSQRVRLLAWAKTAGAYIIEDDYDGEFRYQGKPIPSLQGLDNEGRVIYIGTFSKTLSPALRINYMVVPPSLLHKLSKLHPDQLHAPSRLEQWALERFVREGHWYKHLRKTRNLYRKKHHHLIDLISIHLGKHVHITGLHAGLHLQLSIPRHGTAQELIQLAEKLQVKVYDFRSMWANPPAAPLPVVYLGFAGLPLSVMEEGILRLKKAWFGA